MTTRSLTHCTSGNSCAYMPCAAQCTTASCPSSRPPAASSAAPMHRLATSPPPRWWRASHSISTRLFSTTSDTEPSRGGAMQMSTAPASSSTASAWTVMRPSSSRTSRVTASVRALNPGGRPRRQVFVGHQEALPGGLQEAMFAPVGSRKATFFMAESSCFLAAARRPPRVHGIRRARFTRQRIRRKPVAIHPQDCRNRLSEARADPDKVFLTGSMSGRRNQRRAGVAPRNNTLQWSHRWKST